MLTSGPIVVKELTILLDGWKGWYRFFIALPKDRWNCCTCSLLSCLIWLHGYFKLALRLRWSITMAIRTFLTIHRLGTLLVEDCILSSFSSLQVGYHRRLNIIEAICLIVLLIVQEAPCRWPVLGINIEDRIAGQSTTAYSMGLSQRRALDCGDRAPCLSPIWESIWEYPCHCIHIVIGLDRSWILRITSIEIILVLVTIIGWIMTYWSSKHRFYRIVLAHEIISIVATAFREAFVSGSSVHSGIATWGCSKGVLLILIGTHNWVESLHRSHKVVVSFHLTAIFAWVASEYAYFCLERVLCTKVCRAALATLISNKLLGCCTSNCGLLSLSSGHSLRFATNVIIVVINLHVAF